MIDLNAVKPIGGMSGQRAPSFAEITTRLNERIEDVARALLGEPNRTLSTRAQLRYGNHGSLAIEIAGDKRGEWYDHENKVGGGAIDLVRRHTCPTARRPNGSSRSSAFRSRRAASPR